ncbi:MAG: hypothetical protein HC820_02010 [Hydrococcus sp. RM1_1_31]|nr:hypothetical protein [Hydrococcus sp. RM1_1_31]
MRVFILLFLIVLPGISITGLSAYYLFPEWNALTKSHERFEKLSQSSSATMTDLFIAQAAENRHRINCFAEGVGVLLGMAIASIGIHGICLLNPTKTTNN